MRPVPKPQHLLAALLFVAVAVLYGYQATSDARLSDSQAYLSASSLKYHDPSLFPADAIFGASRLWQVHSPALLGMLDLVLIPSGFSDMTLPFRILVAFVSLVYISSMYALVYRQCRNWSVAAFTAVLSSTVIYGVGSSYWGVGSLGSITPWAICISLMPLIVLAFLRHMHQWYRLLLVFVLTGLMGNIHLAAAMDLAAVLIFVYLGQRQFAPKAWLAAGSFALAALLGAAPFGAYLLALKQSLNPQDVTASAAVTAQAFEMADLAALYPGMLKAMLNWVMVMAIVLVIPAIVVLSKVERYRVRDMKVWVWFFAASLFVSLGIHGLLQALGAMRNSAPVIIDFVQAGSFIMLSLYVMFSQALTNLFRLVHEHRILVRLGCAALMAVWMIPSDNLRVSRYAVLDMATMYMDEQDKPRSIQRHHEAAQRREELEAIGHYAAVESPKDAVFIVRSAPSFRMVSRRSMVACPQDLVYLFYLAPAKLESYLDLLAAQERLLHPASGRADLGQIKQWASELSRQKANYSQAGAWYVILDAEDAPEKESVGEILSSRWGRSYRLFRID